MNEVVKKANGHPTWQWLVGVLVSLLLISTGAVWAALHRDLNRIETEVVENAKLRSNVVSELAVLKHQMVETRQSQARQEDKLASLERMLGKIQTRLGGGKIE